MIIFAPMAKRKRKTMKELANGVAKFLHGKKTNKNNGKLFEQTVKQAVKPRSK
jgi:hypothetical protein